MMLSASLGDRLHWRRSRRRAARTLPSPRRPRRRPRSPTALAAEARRAPAGRARSGGGAAHRDDAHRAGCGSGAAAIPTSCASGSARPTVPSALRVRPVGHGSGRARRRRAGRRRPARRAARRRRPARRACAALARWLLRAARARCTPRPIVEIALLLTADAARGWHWSALAAAPARSRSRRRADEWAALVGDARRPGRRAGAPPRQHAGALGRAVDRAGRRPCAPASATCPALAALLADGPRGRRHRRVPRRRRAGAARGLRRRWPASAGDAGTPACASAAQPARARRGGRSTGSTRRGPRRVARALAPLVDAGGRRAARPCPASCRLLDVLGLGPTDPDALRGAVGGAATGGADTVLGRGRRRPGARRPRRRRPARAGRRARPARASPSCCRRWSPGSPPTIRRTRWPSCSSTTRAAPRSPSAPGCRTPPAWSPTSTRTSPAARCAR